MKRLYTFLIFCVSITLLFQTARAQLTFEPSEYQSRRQKLMEKIEDGCTILLGAQNPIGSYPFYQNNDFLYLTGVRIPNAILVVDGINKESYLFFTISDREARNHGIPLILVHNPAHVTGIEHVYPLEEFEKIGGFKKLTLGEKKEKIKMLIRAYDPCVTCAVH